jgi:hypothetical protein
MQLAERIRDLPQATVESIVSRIPDDFLAPPARQLIHDGLIARKDRLCEEFASWYPGQ